jgi:uncharacterized protein (DUF1778 family)
MVLQAQEWTHRVSARLTEVERAAIDAAATASGKTLSDWVRDALAAAAREAQSAPQTAVKPPKATNPFVAAHERARAAESRPR